MGYKGRCIKLYLKGHLGRVYAVIFSHDNKLLTSSSCDFTVILWNTEAGSLCHTLRGYPGSVYAVAFSPDSRTPATGSNGGLVKLWNSITGMLPNTLKRR